MSAAAPVPWKSVKANIALNVIRIWVRRAPEVVGASDSPIPLIASVSSRFNRRGIPKAQGGQPRLGRLANSWGVAGSKWKSRRSWISNGELGGGQKVAATCDHLKDTDRSRPTAKWRAAACHWQRPAATKRSLSRHCSLLVPRIKERKSKRTVSESLNGSSLKSIAYLPNGG